MKYFVLYEDIWNKTEFIPTNRIGKTILQLATDSESVYIGNDIAMLNGDDGHEPFEETEGNFMMRTLINKDGYTARILILKNPLWEEEENE